MAAGTTIDISKPSTERGWLHSPLVDAFIWGAPWVFMICALAMGMQSPLAVWFGQFVFGNTTHVITTFTLLAVRRDVLHATPTQAKIVIVGSIITFLVSYGLFSSVNRFAPNWVNFPATIGMILGIHHFLSQARGIWSLYNLRAGKNGPPPPEERQLQSLWPSIGLLLLAIRWIFIPTGPYNYFSIASPIPQMEAPLPYVTSYGLLAVWVIFGGFIARSFIKSGAGLPKMLHVGAHVCAVGLGLIRPVWGSVVWGSLHGMEYVFLTARMMRPRDGDQTGIPAWLVWPCIIGSIAPLFFVGFVNGPLHGGPVSPWLREALIMTNAVVMAHYFADAFIYRFRIKEVRQIALHRLGFSPV